MLCIDVSGSVIKVAHFFMMWSSRELSYECLVRLTNLLLKLVVSRVVGVLSYLYNCLVQSMNRLVYIITLLMWSLG